MQLKVSLFQFNVGDNHRVPPRKLRGYVGCTFREHEVVHNHQENGLRYGYPVVQYKVLEDLPTIACYGRGTEILRELFLQLETLNIAGENLPVYERTFREVAFQYGDSKAPVRYEFLSPWLPLNQDNYRSYQELETFEEKKAELERILVGNILSQAKGFEYWVENRLKVDLDFRALPHPVVYKGNRFQGFEGSFTVNFHLPGFLGLGKGVAHGHGTIDAPNSRGA
jgi:hypothetical protein